MCSTSTAAFSPTSASSRKRAVPAAASEQLDITKRFGARCMVPFNISIQTGMLPAASPTKCCKPRCFAPETDALRKDLHNKTDCRIRSESPFFAVRRQCALCVRQARNPQPPRGKVRQPLAAHEEGAVLLAVFAAVKAPRIQRGKAQRHARDAAAECGDHRIRREHLRAEYAVQRQRAGSSR